jgi:hypothetical protein
VQAARGADLALEGGAIAGRREILCAKAVEHCDDCITPEVCRVTHGRTPVAVAYGGVFVQKLRVLQDDFANGVHIVVPDGVNQAARDHKPRPARRFVAAREYELRVSELGVRWFDLLGMVCVKIRERRRIATADGAEQILCLML